MEVHNEWFGTESEAHEAAARLEKTGCITTVRYTLRTDGRHEWLLRVFA